MKIPSVQQAKELLNEASELNPGQWIAHCKTTADCARAIADKCNNLNPDTAYVMGFLHDIGRREGLCDMKHIINGYRFMISKGFDDCARICLTHSFPYKNIQSYNGKNDCSDEETTFITSFIDKTNYDDYDKLIQLCDAVSFPSEAVYIEKRLVDVALRHGISDLTLPKWRAFLALKDYFDEKTNSDIYSILKVK